MGHPSLADRIIGISVCPMCGWEVVIDYSSRKLAVDELLERLNELERNQSRGNATYDE